MRPTRIALLAVVLLLGTLAQPALSPTHTLALHGDTHHPQGIELDERSLWVTSVDKVGKRGFLQEFSLSTGELVRTTDVTATRDRFHPGGLSREGDAFWLPVAEYRRESSAVIQRRNLRTFALEFEFEVTDHIGCLAATPEGLIGGNWDSRDFYVWSRDGRLIRKVANRTPNAYQDIKFVDGNLVASGHLPGNAGAIDWLEYPSLRLLLRQPMGPTDRGVSYTNEGMTLRGQRLFLLPEDSPSRLFEFSLTTH